MALDDNAEIIFKLYIYLSEKLNYLVIRQKVIKTIVILVFQGNCNNDISVYNINGKVDG